MNLRALIEKGLVIIAPETVYVDDSVNVSRISPDVTIHPGCRLSGEKLSIGPGSVIGEEAPATLNNCQLGHQVIFSGGYAKDAVFLDHSSVGSGAHIRPGTLLEEFASAAHTVGLKQTILFPYVTAGSLINFCDCLMAGGTDAKNHSEVGSSYVHFNYSPQGDKATPSLFGDVAQGVFLNKAPIFLGGQGGTVGPVRVDYGTIFAAGSINRSNRLEPETLFLTGNPNEDFSLPYNAKAYGDVNLKFINNCYYVLNLQLLKSWYLIIRKTTMQQDEYRAYAFIAALELLDASIAERLKQFEKFIAKLEGSVDHLKEKNMNLKRLELQQKILTVWPKAKSIIKLSYDGVFSQELLAELNAASGDYLDKINGLSSNTCEGSAKKLLQQIELRISEIEELLHG